MKKLLAAVLLSALALPTYAWGPQGHKLVALVAMDHLTPLAKQNVRALLGAETLADVASWPDVYRPMETQTASWHYVDIPEHETTYVRDRDCPVQPTVKMGSPADKYRDCVVDRILFFEGRLKDTTLDTADRATALKYLVHFVGDIHQPFHATDVERGGNGINVVVFGSDKCGNYNCNLHSVWDSGLILHRQWTDLQYKTALEAAIRKDKLQTGTLDPALWAGDSKVLADAAMVPKGGAVDQAYFDKNIVVVDHQLEIAGLRLAAILNSTFTAPPKPFKPTPADSTKF